MVSGPLKAGRSVGVGVLFVALVLIAFGVAFVSAARGSSSTPACSAASTQVWLGLGEGGGFAGGNVLPIEFSNTGRHACTLLGYPGVSAYRGALHQVGPAAARIPERAVPVTLAPGASAHALLKIADTGAVCGRSAVSAAGLRVYPPGQRAAKVIPWTLRVCARRTVLSVGVVRPGVGVPGYITQ